MSDTSGTEYGENTDLGHKGTDTDTDDGLGKEGTIPESDDGIAVTLGEDSNFNAEEDEEADEA
jgi:hypothetical protein